MILINLDNEDDARYELTITGHSGYRRQGRDIVCSAVSVLRYTMDCYLGGDGILQEGECYLLIPKDDILSVAVLSAIWESFKHIEEEYPDFVEIGGGMEYE